MSVAGGPRLEGIGRSGDSDLMLCLDALDASSYPGEPTTNKSYAASSPYSYLGQNYDWNNSGNSTRTDNAKDVPKPKGYESTNIWVCRKETTAVGNQHFGMGFNTGISGSTQYTLSMWYRQSRAGVGGPYIRGYTSNANHGALAYKGVTGTSNWPVNEWIRITATATTASNENGLYISNYIGAVVGDTAWAFGPQIEAKAYMTPIVLNTTQTAAASARSATEAWKDLSGRNNNGTFTTSLYSGAALSRDGQVLTSFYSGANPVFSNYIDFDGTDDSVTVSKTNMSASDLNAGGGFTLSAWVKSNNIATTQNIISRNGPYFMRITSSKLRMCVYTTSGGWLFQNGLATLSSDTWYNLVITYDKSRAKSYINGVVDRDIAKTGDITSNGNQYLGYTPVGGEQASLDGQIGKVSIYKGGLTADQVKANFNAHCGRFGVGPPTVVRSGLMGYWDAGKVVSYSGSGSTWYDISGNGNNATLSGLTFNSGSGGYFKPTVTTTGSATTPSFANAATMTMECWYKSSSGDSFTTYGRIMDRGDTTISLGTYGTYQLRSWVYAGGGRTSPENVKNGIGQDGLWHHIGYTFDGSTARFYFDGTYVNYASRSGALESPYALTLFTGDGYGFGGQIAVARYYSTVLSAAQIVNNFQADRERFGV